MLPLMKRIFFFTPIAPALSSSGIWVSFDAMKCSLKGYPLRIIWADDHFQIIITTKIILGQYKIQSSTWSSFSPSLRTNSYGSHATTWPFVMKTPSLFTRSHLTPCHSDLCFSTTFEFLRLTPSPYFTLSC